MRTRVLRGKAHCFDGVFSSVAMGDLLELDLNAGTLINETSGVRLTFKPYPEFILETLDAGGLYAGHLANAAS